MALKLSRVDRGPHLPTLVASSITREIAQGRLKPGDQLPTEQALAETFGVSRNVVREAIARLRFEGRVWSRQGRGAFVSSTTQTNLLKIEHDDAQPRDVFAALFQFRGILEVQGAALAAQLRTKADLEQIRNAVDAMAAAPYGSINWLNGDLAFHQAIAAATRNTYFVQVLAFVAEQVRESILAAGGQSHSDDMAQATEREHRAILAAIEAQEQSAAQKAMADHLAGAAIRVGPALGKAETATDLKALSEKPGRKAKSRNGARLLARKT